MTRATFVAWSAAVLTAVVPLVTYTLTATRAADISAAEAVALFSFKTWRAITVAIAVAVGMSMALALVALPVSGIGARARNAVALLLGSGLTALAVGIPLLGLLYTFAFFLGPGPCGSSFYDPHDPECAARDAGLSANLLAGGLGTLTLVALVFAARAIGKSAGLRRLAVLAAVVVGAVAGAGSCVALSGLVPEETVQRAVSPDRYLRGTVTSLLSGRAVHARVEAHRSSGGTESALASGFTKSDGSYEIPLEPGRYRVLFIPFDHDPGVSAEWWPGADSFEMASDVVVPGDASTISARLRPRHKISGRVTSRATGSAIAGMSVIASFSSRGNSSAYVSRAKTDGDGRFAVHVPRGVYRLDFEVIGYVPSYWRDAVYPAPATFVRVDVGDVEGIDHVVPPPTR